MPSLRRCSLIIVFFISQKRRFHENENKNDSDLHLEEKRCKSIAGNEKFDREERNIFHSIIPGADDSVIQTAGEIYRAGITSKLGLYPGAREFLMAMRQSGRKICLMSNAQEIHILPELRALRMIQLFDEFGISSDFFYKKPSEIFYQIMIDKVGLAPEEILMIGNNAEDDIVTPHNMGIRTCLIKSNQSPAEESRDHSDSICDIYLEYPEESRYTERSVPLISIKGLFEDMLVLEP